MLRRLLNRLLPSPGPSYPADLEEERRLEIASLQNHLDEIQAELREVEQCARILKPGAIPASLLRSRRTGAEALPADGLEDSDRKAADQNLTALEQRRDHLRQLLALAEQERDFLHRLLVALRPGMNWEEAGAALHPVVQKPFELSGFYLARADWERKEIWFPFFFEAGCPRRLDPCPLEPTAGLTGWAIFEGEPRYLDSGEACRAQGMRLTEAEFQTGLYTKSWFGVPLPGQDRPCGLMGFHCFHAQAFSPDRRRLMTTVARLTALHLDQSRNA